MPRVGFPGGPRLNWYDRNPACKVGVWSGSGVAPHAATQRLSYTVPSGKKAIIEVLECSVIRKTAATTAGVMQGYAVLTPYGGPPTTFLVAWIETNTVDARSDRFLGGAVTLFAGDVLALKTLDLSTGGTGSYFQAYKGTEFSA